MTVICAKLTLSPPPRFSVGKAHTAEADRKKYFTKRIGNDEEFSRTFQKHSSYENIFEDELNENCSKDASSNDTRDTLEREDLDFVLLVFFLIFVYLIVRELSCLKQQEELETVYTDTESTANLIEGYIQLSRLSDIPLRQ